MSVDRQLQEQVLAALEREPGVEAGTSAFRCSTAS